MKGGDIMKNCVFKSGVNTISWFKAAGIRALKTIAQTALAMIPAGVMISAVDWKVVLSTAALSGVVSLLTSIVGIPEVEQKEEE